MVGKRELQGQDAPARRLTLAAHVGVSAAVGECKFTPHHPESLRLQTLAIPSAGEGKEKSKFLCTAAGNTSVSGNLGKQSALSYRVTLAFIT